MRVVVLLTVLAAVAQPAAWADVPAPQADEPATATWRVVSVHDGDTVVCLDDHDAQQKVRLSGIDAPEIGQAFGTKSRDALRSRVMRKSVAVHQHGQDQYGRTLATLEIEGDDVAEWMVAAGMAWHYKRYSDDKVLAAAERKARTARRGLWADRDPTPPWEWRASERDRKKPRPAPAGPAGATPASRPAAPRTSARPPPKAVPAASPGPRRAAAVVGADAE
jgi:micrococcal nuclease